MTSNSEETRRRGRPSAHVALLTVTRSVARAPAPANLQDRGGNTVIIWAIQPAPRKAVGDRG